MRFTTQKKADIHVTYEMRCKTYAYQNNDGGGDRSALISYLNRDILNYVEVDPSISTRIIVNNSNVSYVTVWRVLQMKLIYAYYLQRIQGL
ncbi:hypothetical protein Trydic_g15458 [Trypoxylus dichotomus]